MFNPKPETCEFVPASVLFEGLTEAFTELSSWDNLPFSWGDNNRTLVTASRILEELEALEEGNPENKGVAEACQRLRDLSETYIDLEN